MNAVAMPLWSYSGGGPGPGGLAGSCSPPFVYGYRTTPGSVVSSACTCTAVNGTPPYTYAWIEVDESGGGYPYPSGISPTSAASASTTFSKYFGSSGSKTGWFKCQVTDATLATALSNEIEVLLEMGT